MSLGLVIDGLVVTGMRNGSAGSRVGLLQRRRDDAGELGDQKRATRSRIACVFVRNHCMTALAAQGSDSDSGPSGSERQSHVRFAVYRPKPVQTGRSQAPDGSCAERARHPFPRPHFSSKDPPRGAEPRRRLRDAREARPFFVRPIIPGPSKAGPGIHNHHR